jgi:hypothetical protein
MTMANVPRLLKSGRFKNVFHQGIGWDSPGSTAMQSNDVYAEVEEDLWGYPPTGVEADSRPIFGYLTDDPDAEASPESQVWDYGDVNIVLKDHLRPRTTFAMHDSMAGVAQTHDMGQPNSMVAPLNSPNLETYSQQGLDILKLNHIQDGMLAAEENQYWYSYAEIQMHEGVTLDDIDYFVFDTVPGYELEQLLKEKGKPWIMSKRRERTYG